MGQLIILPKLEASLHWSAQLWKFEASDKHSSRPPTEGAHRGREGEAAYKLLE